MMRSFLIYLSHAAWAKKIVTKWSFAWRAASRFIAGETLEQGIEAVRRLNAKGIYATLDQLGEHTVVAADAERTTTDILKMIDAIDQAGVQSNVSIKLSQIGLNLSDELCAQLLKQVLEYANSKSIFVRIDMEESSLVDRTLKLYCQMRDEGLDNTGVVIQSYLYRSEKDILRLSESGTCVRLCKGAYQEPAEVAFPKKSDVDSNYDRLAELLIDSSQAHGAPESTSDGRYPAIPAIASHDPERLAHAKAYARQVGLPKRALEFQMLHGIRRDLQEQTVREGYPVRIYVPFGTQWYPYYMRRLAERPANVWFFITNFFKK